MIDSSGNSNLKYIGNDSVLSYTSAYLQTNTYLSLNVDALKSYIIVRM